MEEELAAMKQTSVSIEIPVSENEMDLEHEKTQEIFSKLNEEALKRKDLVEAGAEKKMTDMYINNLNSRYPERTKQKQNAGYYCRITGLYCWMYNPDYIKKKKEEIKNPHRYVENRGVEPLTYCMPCNRSSQLS